MEQETIEQSRLRIQGYVEKIHLIKKHVEDALYNLIDFLKKSHELRKDLADVFISAAEDIHDDVSSTIEIQSLLSEDGTIEQDEAVEMLISSLKDFSFTAKIKKAGIDAELEEKIEKAAKDLDEAFHEEIDPILGLIAEEQHKIEEMREKS